MITDENLRELETKGVTVVPGVLTEEECDAAVSDYKAWLSSFGNSFPNSVNSLIRGDRVGHIDVTWRLRLKVKPVFAQLWNTEKLLTSFDTVAIGRPPEDGIEAFDDPDKHWLHSDSTPARVGLHAYQGALYLEEQEENDWTFLVMEGSHRKLDELFNMFPESAKNARKCGCHFDLSDNDVEYFKQCGCQIRRVPVPKGGLALWDSRLVHANARPIKNRKNAGRWRFVTFISMTPAIWANDLDISKHRKMYKTAAISTHWSSQGIKYADDEPYEVTMETLPVSACTEEAMKLSGILSYDYNDGKPNGDGYIPIWRRRNEVNLLEDEDMEKVYSNGHI